MYLKRSDKIKTDAIFQKLKPLKMYVTTFFFFVLNLVDQTVFSLFP